MRQLLPILLAFYMVSCGVNLSAQEIIAETGSYGIDKKNKIIVWHVNNLDSILSLDKKVTSVRFNETFKLKEASRPLSYTEGHVVYSNDDYVLYITKIPLIHITINT